MQTNPPNRRQQLLSTALVAVFAFSGLGVLITISEPAEALVGLKPSSAAGGLDILTPTIGVDHRGGQEEAVIRVANPAATGQGAEDFAITTFILSINNSVAANPSPIQQFYAIDSEIDRPGWKISETLDCDGPDRNLLPGWGNCIGLLFQAEKEEHYIYPGTEVTFTVSYEAVSSYPSDSLKYCTYGGDRDWADDTPSIRVIGQHDYISEAAAPPGPHITSVKTPESEDPDAYWVKMIIDDHASPEPLESVTLVSGQTTAGTYLVDEDHNGHLDHVYIQFDKELDPETIDVRDFSVGKADKYPVLKVEVINSTSWQGDNPATPQDEARRFPMENAQGFSFCPNFSMVKLKFDEENVYDTGELPDIKYKTKGGDKDADPRDTLILTSLAAVRVASVSDIGVADRAQPILAAAIIKMDEVEPRNNVHVLVHFSEPVGPTVGNAACNVGAPVGLGGLSVPDFRMSSRTAADTGDVLRNLITWNPPPHMDGNAESGDAWLEHYEGKAAVESPEQIKWLHFKYNTSDFVSEPPRGFQKEHLEYRFESDQSFIRIEEQATPNRMDLDPNINICDEANNEIYDRQGASEDPEPLAEPTIVSADGNIGFDKITVEFTTPVIIPDVKLADGEAEDIEPHEIFTIAAGRETGTGVEGLGVIDIIHEDCSEKAIIHLSRPLIPSDVSGDPTFLRVEGQRVFTCGADQFSVAPEVSEFKTLGWPLRAQDREIVDVTPPSVVFALTRDIDGNGEVDAYEFWMSEVVQDTSFEEGNPGQDHVIMDVEDHINYRRVDVGEPNDRFLTIGFQPLSPDQGYDTHRIPQVSAIAKNVSGRWQGMVMDQAFNADLRTGNWMENATIDDIKEFDGALPRVMVAETLDRDEDGLLDAYRITFSEPIRDDSFDPAHWFVGPDDEYKILGIDDNPEWDRAPNDAVLILEFQEKKVDPLKPIGDTGLPHKPPELTYFAPAGEGIEDLADLPASLGGPNRMLNFGTDKIIERDAAPPVLMAALACEETDAIQIYMSEGVVSKDSDDQSPRKVDSDDLFYTNGGGPVAGLREDSAIHIQGDQVIVISTDSKFTTADFGTDKVHVVQDPKEPENTEFGIMEEIDGDLHANWRREVTVERGKDIIPPETVNDIDFDPDDVFAAGLEFRVQVPHDDGCPDVSGADPKDPATVGFVVKVNKTSISSQGFDNVPPLDKALIQYIWKDPVTGENKTAPSAKYPTLTDLIDGTTTQNAAGEDEVNVGLGVLEGQNLTVRITGLEPDTDYWMAIAPFDRENNVGAPSPTLAFHTAIDLTSPVLPEEFEIRSDTHKRGIPSKVTEPVFEWDAASDPESVTVFYRYALSKTETYEVDANSDPPVVGERLEFTPELISEFTSEAPTGLAPPTWYEGPAEWYFHLSACSGGGCTPAGSYHFLVDAPVNSTEMKEANALIETDVVYDEETGDYIVNWAFPKQGLPCEAAGVQIWRRDAGDAGFRHLATFGKNDRGFQDSRYVDPDSGSATLDTKYLVTMKCPDSAVTYWDGQEFQAATVDGAGLFPSDRSPPVENYDGTSARKVDAPFSVPLWVWIVLGVILLLVVIGLIAFFSLRKGSETELWEEGEIEESEMAGFGDPNEAPPGEDEPDDGPDDERP